MYCLVKNGEVLPCSLPSGAWLEAAPRGAYTTARTVGGGSSVFELSFHIQRLASSAALMKADAAAAAGAADGAPAGTADGAPAGAAGAAGAAAGPSVAAAVASDPERLRPRLLPALRAAVQGYRAATGDADGELKLTVLVTWPGCDQKQGQQRQDAAASNGHSSAGAGTAGVNIFVHASPLPPRPAPPVRVVVRGAPRSNAAAKDSEWVRQRKAIEAGLPPDVNEAVLVGAGGALYEGLTSNFFAVVDGTIYTAGEGVLAGTKGHGGRGRRPCQAASPLPACLTKDVPPCTAMRGQVREVTLEVARREGLPVVLEPPRLADLPRWEGCFISSTSRLLLPVDEASVFPEEAEGAAQGDNGGDTDGSNGSAGAAAGPATRCFARRGLVQRLEQLVLAEVAACSEPLFD
ncbi:hypothetical protein ABPG75_013618 [Micractinium tetrahymenae]